MKQLLPICCLLIVLVSCSVQKRKYQKGYFVSRHSKKVERSAHHGTKVEPAKKTVSKKDSAQVVYTNPINTTEANALKRQDHFSKKNKSKLFLSEPDSCDIIVFNDGSEISIKVEEVGIDQIKYKRCDYKDGPMYVTLKSEVFMIKYMNGTKDVIKKPKPIVPATNPAKTSGSEKYKSNNPNRKNHPLATIALILSVLSVIIGYGMILNFLATAVWSVLILLPIFLGIVAIVLGVIANSKIKDQRDVYKGNGMAICSFIMGAAFAGLYVLSLFMMYMFTL